jgi:5-(carboxyamino)imidazole ribonucleotide synthase
MRTLDKPVPPGGTIGIIGGGQLGRMLALAAARLGLKTLIYNDEPDAPAFQVTPLQIVAPYDDRAMLAGLANVCDVVTFEFENLPADAIEFLSERVPVRPGPKALATTQDRLIEKNFVVSLGLKTAPFFEVSSADQARAAFGRLGGEGILKTRRLGYDGKGQMRAISAEDAVLGYQALKSAPSILEGFVEFSFEASVIAARCADGSFAAYDPPENVHEHHILRRSTVPSRLSAAQMIAAKEIARKIADALDYVGVLAVELFVGPVSITPATGRWRLAAVPSSSSTSARWQAGRWAIPHVTLTL